MRWIWKTGDWSCSAMDVSKKTKPANRDGAGCSAHYVAGLVTAPRGLNLGVQERHQAALLVERDQVVAAAHPRLADEDLRHRAAASLGDHHVALRRIQVDADL